MKNRATFAVVSALLTCGISHAQMPFTWDGDGPDELMTTGDNWAGGVAPLLDVDGDTFNFGDTFGIGSLTPDVGDADFFNIGAFTFTNADGNYTIQDLFDLGK